jgi:conjugative transposon TraJ protein
MKKWSVIYVGIACLCMPVMASAQSGMSNDVNGLQAVLDTIYDQMLPLCSRLIGVGRAIAGFAATWYIASRVWRHISHAEPVDFYPLFRPFVLGFAILVFPSVIGMMNGVLKPTVTATAGMVQDSDKAIAVLLAQKEQAIKNSDFWKMYVGPDGNGDRDRWYQYTHPEDPTGSGEGAFEYIGNSIQFAMAKMSYNFRNSVKQWLSEVLQLFYAAASLCINTIRTFYLVVLAILGPIVFGLAVFDGLQHTLTIWLARYINVFLWLPVANIFGSIIGKIQENMIKLDINQIQSNGDTYFSSLDTGYLVFLIIGIFGYFTVPSVSNYIVQAGGGNMLLMRVSNAFSSTSNSIISTAGSGVSAISGTISSGISSMAGSGKEGNQQSDFMVKKVTGEHKNS